MTTWTFLCSRCAGDADRNSQGDDSNAEGMSGAEAPHETRITCITDN